MTRLLVIVCIVVGCESSSDGGTTYPTSSRNSYYCVCKGDGLLVTMSVTSSSLGAATSFAEDSCEDEYPDHGCSCECETDEENCDYRRPNGTCVEMNI